MQLFKWVQLAIGYVFIISGAVKLLVPSFIDYIASLGIPFPSVFLLLLALIEILCGTLMIANMYIKHATITLIVVMIGALVLAKVPVFFQEGFLSFLFESRLDITMLILLLLLWRHHQVSADMPASS